MIDRRTFLRRSAILASGLVAADQIELLERLTHRKVFTTGGYDPMVYYFDLNRTTDAIEGKILEYPAGKKAVIYWKNPAPLTVEIPMSEYRRRFGLQGHHLAFDSEGRWLVPPAHGVPLFPTVGSWVDALKGVHASGGRNV